MAYTISKTDGTTLTTIADGTVDTTTNLTLIGKNYAGYGDFLNENLIRLLENAASTSAPVAPIAGQLWWDKANNLLKVYTGVAFKTVSSSTAQATPPTTTVIGDLWWDTTNNQLNVFNGAAFTLIGPAFTTGTGTSGTQVGTIIDNATGSHVAVNVYVQNTQVAIISKDSTYTPQTPITGFTTIKPGFNLVNTATVAGAAYYGTASDASALGNVAAANYARLDVPAVHTSTITVNNNSGLTIGTNNNFTQTVVSNVVTLTNNINNANIAIKANVGGTSTTVMNIDGSTGLITVAANATANLGLATLGQLNAATGGGTTALLRDGSRSVTGALLPQTSSVNLGAAGQTFGNVYANYFIGTSIQAQYADLAERFESDAAYEAGTVVAIGGAKEITAAAEELSESVFGVISTKAAYLMNAAAGSDSTHPAVAVNGRVPVRVIGQVKKGDRLVAAGNGLARAGLRSEITSFNVIGRSLQDKTTDGAGTILAIVKLNS